MISVQHLTKQFGGIAAISDVSFEAKNGEVLGFLGPNGAGKTTTMRILTGYLPATSGSVNIAGHDIVDDSLAARKKIGYLPESAPLYPDLNVLEYLTFIAKLRGIPKGQVKQRITNVVKTCALERVLLKDIGELSKGYRQRVGLAQALIHDPEILILDEPTSGLDPKQIIEIRELIKRIGKEKTIIFSTHILSEVESTCDRVLIINNGKIVTSGTHDELVAAEVGLQKIYVEIEGPLAAIHEALIDLPGVREVKVGDTFGQSHHQFVVESDQERNVRKAIFEAVVKRGWTLLEMRKENMNLEEVFLKLTRS